MQEWFLQLGRRDQSMVALLAVCVALYLIYTIAWRPLAQARENLRTQNDAAQQRLEEVVDLAARYQALSAGAGPGAVDTRTLPTIIDEAVSRNNLRMGRFQPSSSGDVQIRFDNANFDDMLRWLYEMAHEHHVLVKEISIAPGTDTGLVNVSVRLYRD